jgi:hypothetical protein
MTVIYNFFVSSKGTFTWEGSWPFLQTLVKDGNARDKHSSLLRKFVNYGRKKFYGIQTRMASHSMTKPPVVGSMMTSPGTSSTDEISVSGQKKKKVNFGTREY